MMKTTVDRCCVVVATPHGRLREIEVNEEQMIQSRMTRNLHLRPWIATCDMDALNAVNYKYGGRTA